ncbi:MAG: AMP-binding protein, partial [Bacteroidales bacterium]|nr:AMP-binding protein [Bacteroidales bacterium]
GENVMKGYWKNEEATNEAIKDGWLYTSDMGSLDRDGFLFVLGRFKSLLIGSDGEKFSPEGIEESVVEKSGFIDEIVLINNQHPYTSAMIVINKATAKAYLKSNNLKPGSEGAKVLINKLKDEIDHFREGGAHSGMFPSRWLPATFSILDKPFTQDNRMMNASLKMVRNVILSHYSDRLDYMYTTEGKEVHNEKNYEALLKYLNE